MSKCGQYFTVVFKGDISKLDRNPLHLVTPLGDAVACRNGDVLETLDAIESYVARNWPEADDLIDYISETIAD